MSTLPLVDLQKAAFVLPGRTESWQRMGIKQIMQRRLLIVSLATHRYYSPNRNTLSLWNLMGGACLHSHDLIFSSAISFDLDLVLGCPPIVLLERSRSIMRFARMLY